MRWLMPCCESGKQIPLTEQSLFGLCALHIAAVNGHTIGECTVPPVVASEVESLLGSGDRTLWLPFHTLRCAIKLFASDKQ